MLSLEGQEAGGATPEGQMDQLEQLEQLLTVAAPGQTTYNFSLKKP